MLDWQALYENSAHVRFFKPVSADAFAGHPGSALAAKLFPPSSLGMVLSNPADAKADLAIRIRHAGSGKFGLREET